MPADTLLDWLECTFADAYRREIDGEENVWRSLPFFTATLALQLAAVAQVRDWVSGQAGAVLLASEAMLALASGATLAALVLLVVSVWPVAAERVSDEPEFLDYVETTRRTVRELSKEAGEQDISDLVLATVRQEMLRQYASAASRNRRVNRQRTKWRTLAGLATLLSVLAMLALVALGVLSNIHGRG